VDSILDFDKLEIEDQIVFFGYFLQEKAKMSDFEPKDIGKCFSLIRLPKPTNIPSRLNILCRKPKKRFVKHKTKYNVAYFEVKIIKESLGGRISYLPISQELQKLPSYLSKTTEKNFLQEVITCYRSKSWRAVLVLMWILTIDHLQVYVLKKKLKQFNLALNKNPKYKTYTVKKKEDFEDIKESIFILTLRIAKIISKNQKKILDQKLDDRNSYAHPSALKISPSKAESFIEDLIKNIISVIKY